VLEPEILFGEGHPRRAIDQFLAHYHAERTHQGLGNELIDGEADAVGEITSRERLIGLLRYYHSDSAQRRFDSGAGGPSFLAFLRSASGELAVNLRRATQLTPLRRRACEKVL
jgi:hypothetical protein